LAFGDALPDSRSYWEAVALPVWRGDRAQVFDLDLGQGFFLIMKSGVSRIISGHACGGMNMDLSAPVVSFTD